MITCKTQIYNHHTLSRWSTVETDVLEFSVSFSTSACQLPFITFAQTLMTMTMCCCFLMRENCVSNAAVIFLICYHTNLPNLNIFLYLCVLLCVSLSKIKVALPLYVTSQTCCSFDTVETQTGMCKRHQCLVQFLSLVLVAP